MQLIPGLQNGYIYIFSKFQIAAGSQTGVVIFLNFVKTKKFDVAETFLLLFLSS